MKIAYFSHSLLPSRYANSVHVMKLSQAFAKLGHEVTLYGRVGDEPADDLHAYYGVDRCFEAVRIAPRWSGRLALWDYVRQVRRAMASRPAPELCFGRELYTLSASGSLGAPLILDRHHIPDSRLLVFLERRLFRKPNFARLTCISRPLADEYRQLFPELTDAQVRVAPNGGEIMTYDPADFNGGRPLGRPGHLQAGYVGHLYKGRGIEVILESARRLPDVDFHVVGGSEEDLAYWRDHARAIPNVTLHGHVSPARTGAFRQAVDVLLAPYQRSVRMQSGSMDSSRWLAPIKIFEYMASGTAMIASDLKPLYDFLRPEENALLAPPEDIDAWVAAIRRLADDPDLRRRLGQRARQDASREFTWTRRAERILDGVSV